jgi:hypothetical protein
MAPQIRIADGLRTQSKNSAALKANHEDRKDLEEKQIL